MRLTAGWAHTPVGRGLVFSPYDARGVAPAVKRGIQGPKSATALPSGRVGPSGPERVYGWLGVLTFGCVKNPSGPLPRRTLPHAGRSCNSLQSHTLKTARPLWVRVSKSGKVESDVRVVRSANITCHSRCSLRERYVRFAERTTTIERRSTWLDQRLRCGLVARGGAGETWKWGARTGSFGA